MNMKKLLFPVLIIATGLSVWAFRAKDEKPVVHSKQDELLSAIASILERKHFSPKNIDDKFSKQVFEKYFETLNPDKDIFLQSDINSLKKYETAQIGRAHV